MDKASRRIARAQKIADERLAFFGKRRAAVGDHDTNSFMAELRKRVAERFGGDIAEKRFFEDRRAVDFYDEAEGTILEIENRRWLPDMDLNHDKQIQSLLCYRYTIGQAAALTTLKKSL